MTPRPAPAQNQAPPLQDYNVFETDVALVEAFEHACPGETTDELFALGAMAGAAEWIERGRLANEYPPQLRTHDRYGNRIDEVEYHPAYHELMRAATTSGLHGTAWESGGRFAHTMRAAKFYVWSQVEAGHVCPISMTYAAVPALRTEPRISALWEPRLAARAYEPALLPIVQKTAATCGMAMTEKQGGSDVRANQTRATFVERTPYGDAYLLNGHKWFCSAPMSDAFLVLAQAPAGITCFLMPRVLEGGSKNTIALQRLKDKLGNRSNASSEIELDDALAFRIGEEGRGVRTIVEMVNFTRLDCIAGSAALMRQATAQAIHHAMHRSAFGKLLIDQPLMQNVLADIALESEAALVLLLRVASCVDAQQSALKRLGTAVGKYFVCKRTALVVAEALESLGGNGYVEESGMPRLYREAPLNSIWEGSGNINALDVLRILEKEPATLDAFEAEIEPACDDARIAQASTQLRAMLRGREASEQSARWIVERIALLWQATLLARDGASIVAGLFIDSRIAGRRGSTLGTLPASAQLRDIALRAAPAKIVEYTRA